MKIPVHITLLLFLLIGTNSIARAASVWNVTSGNWNTAGNWIGGVPTASIQAQIGTTTSNRTATVTSASAAAKGVIIGVSSGNIGTVIVDGGTLSSYTNSSIIGYQGSGTLTIQSGGKFLAHDNAPIIGYSVGSTGLVSVTGAGSQLVSDYSLYVGYDGTGTLTVSAGGTAKAGAGNGTVFANSGSAKGTLNLNGTAGSRGVLETAYLNEGSGTGGGHINFNGGILRATADSTDFLQNFEDNDVQILSGGAFFDTNGYNVTINSTVQFGGTGGLTKQGAGTLTLTGDRNYYGTNVVEAGTLANTGYGFLGYVSGDTSSMTVSGSGSQWSSSSNLYVGLSGSGTLNVQSGGTVSSAAGILGYNSGSAGTVTVSGTGSQWSNSGILYVGYLSGNGTLNIQSGGTVSSAAGSIGGNLGATGTVTVSGSGSQWSDSGSLNVGVSGSGTLTVDAGGRVLSGVGYGTVLATITGSSTGTLNLNGTSGSRGVLETAFVSEGSGTGGGHINFNGGILRATADSADFLQNFEAGDVQVASGGAFIDTNGHTVTVNSTVQFNGTGGITKQGAGTLTLSGDRIYQGTNTVEAGTLANAIGYLGYAGRGPSSMTVTGSGSQWNNSGNLYVGSDGPGTLTIQSGGAVSNFAGYVGAGSQSEVTVDGSGSQWSSGGNLYVGYSSGTGTLTIQNGGAVSNAYGDIGSYDGGVGTVSVTGPGSLWSSNGAIYIGDFGVGTLSVDAGGKSTATALVGLAYGGTSTGTLNLNGTGGSRGVLETAYITEGSGSGGGTINFNGGILRATADSTDFLQNFEAGDVQIQNGGAFVDTRNFNAGISTALQGTGGLNKLGTGTLTLSGASTYTGTTTVEAGKLVVTGSLTGDATLVQSGATLAGTGSVQEVTVQSGGTISPGVGLGDIGTLNTGSETWAGGGTFLWDVKAKPAEGTAGTNWDFINMSGGLDIAATSADKFIIGINGSLTGIVPFSLLDWTMLSASDGFDGTFSADKFTLDTTHFTSDIEGSFSLFTQGNSLVLEFVASPEPGRMLLLVLGSTVMLLRRRRQR